MSGQSCLFVFTVCVAAANQMLRHRLCAAHVAVLLTLSLLAALPGGALLYTRGTAPRASLPSAICLASWHPAAVVQVLNALEHRFDNPSNIPARELAKLIYGRDSVFARDPTPQQIAGITRQDLQGFLTTWERPDAAVLGICGDFDSLQV